MTPYSSAPVGSTAGGHFMRNVFSNVPKATGPMVASIIRTIFAQLDTEHVFTQFHELIRMLTRAPEIANMLEDSQNDILAFRASPTAHRQQFWSRTRWNGSTRRSNAAPTSSARSEPAALLRLAGDHRGRATSATGMTRTPGPRRRGSTTLFGCSRSTRPERGSRCIYGCSRTGESSPSMTRHR